MGAVSYPQQNVVDFITSELVPLQIPADHKELGPKFRVKWTPTLILLDAAGAEYYRTLGFFPPEELIPSLLLGMGKTCFDKADRTCAVKHMEKVIREFPNSASAAEAVYLRGVANYIETHDVSHLKALHITLMKDYPESPWVKRASPYGLL